MYNNTHLGMKANDNHRRHARPEFDAVAGQDERQTFP